MTIRRTQLKDLPLNYATLLVLLSFLLQSHALIFLAKTMETFKLAELQFLEARLQADSNHYNLTRLLVDRSTGSTLLRLDMLEDSSLLLADRKLPSSLNRCDWVAEVLEEGETPELLIDRLRQSPPETDDLWALDYVRIESAGLEERIRPTCTKKSLLCSVSQALPTIPALNPVDATQQMLIIDTKSLNDTSCYLGKTCVSTMRSSLQSTIPSEWAKRPFQYSSAINMNVAEIVIDLLLDMTTQSSDTPVTLFDPTCGSGTFLAFAIGKGMRVEACDCNPSCVDGSVRNLIHVFGEEKVESMTNIQLHDSSSSSSSMWKESETEIDCVVANLAWGVNSIEYVKENSRILKSVRARLSTGIPCAFVTRDPDPNLFTDSDFEVLGQAFVPQRDFALPKGKKKKEAEEIERNGRTRCVITIARSK
jgi:hypothetical protein